MATQHRSYSIPFRISHNHYSIVIVNNRILDFSGHIRFGGTLSSKGVCSLSVHRAGEKTNVAFHQDRKEHTGCKLGMEYIII